MLDLSFADSLHADDFGCPTFGRDAPLSLFSRFATRTDFSG